MTAPDPLWTPAEDRRTTSQMHAFMRAMSEKYGIEPTWPALHQWSVDEAPAFWREMIRLAQIDYKGSAEPVREGDAMLNSNWFPNVSLNFAAHLLRFGDERPAIIARDERQRERVISYAELRIEVARVAAALKQAGVTKGDRVAGFLPNIPEAVIAMLAAAGLGAIWSSCSPDFGIGSVFDRFGQIEPKVLFCADGYSYNGKPIDSLPEVKEIARRIPSIRQIVVVPFSNDAPDIADLPGAALWNDFLSSETELSFEMVPFDHPLYIMYSSGTTGVPKCIVHGHGGTLLQHMKELMLHTDLRRDDRLFYFTTCGWMMWNWLVSGLGVGAAIVLYEGAPFCPSPDHLWQFADNAGITVFGTSPKYLSACEKEGLVPKEQHDLSNLRAVLSTGSPLTVENFRWVYASVKDDLQLSSICGGTDIISCFMLGNPILPVYPGEIQSIGLGMDVRAFDETGKPVIGQKGELVCCSPFPSQPVGFWNDDDGSKYRSAYFDVYDGIWRHGDFVEITERGGVIVYGRSDATLNPGGVRIGTAEIYRQVESIEEIVDSVVVGKPTEDADVEVCLFVVLREGLTLSEDLTKTIKQRIAEGTTKRHVPRHIRQVSAVPYTISGKKVELAITRVLTGESVPNKDALKNPEALDQYAGII